METVLVVDDEPTVLTLCQRILERGGYTALAAPDGFEALRLLQTHHVDLALLDVMMPRMNGLELARKIQAEKPDVKIVLMSGYGPQEIGRVVGNIQPHRVIWKPFKTESLLRMIENVLSGSLSPGVEGS
jgi:CheY-like chemotaxis protein